MLPHIVTRSHLPWALFFHAGLYILATLAANYTAAWFLPLPFFGVISVGTLFFGITFTQRDRVHHYGRPAVYATIAAAAVLNALESVFLGIPGRIIVASFTAIVLSEAADTEVYHRLLQRSWLVRVASSNAVSIPLDTCLFTLIAFAGDPNVPSFWQIVGGDLILKGTISMAFALWRTQANAPLILSRRKGLSR